MLRRAQLVRPATSRHPRSGFGELAPNRMLLAGMDRRRELPRPPVARAPTAERADLEGPHLLLDRSAPRGSDDLAARVPRRGAELGLSLHLGARCLVHALGPACP